jgi:type IV pilus assembly protein PilE
MVTSIRKSNAGFSLIELMVVVGIIGILASIAYPSYRDHVARAKRADAQSTLLQGAQWMQRYYAANNGYTGAATAYAAGPHIVSPKAGEGAVNYNITVSSATASTFELTATRAGGMLNDKCGNFTLTDSGAKGLASADSSQSTATCWR